MRPSNATAARGPGNWLDNRISVAIQGNRPKTPLIFDYGGLLGEP